VVTGPCGGCHPLMLPSATNFLNPCLCDSAAFLRGAGVAEWLFANDFRACVNSL
jgi:hypothetical protein